MALDDALYVCVLDSSTLLHQNSSLPCPVAETEKMARAALRGKLAMTLDAGVLPGMVKTLGLDPLVAWRAEIGMMVSAGMRACGALKKFAVMVTLYVPIRVESSELGRSMIIVCGSFHSVMNCDMSFM